MALPSANEQEFSPHTATQGVALDASAYDEQWSRLSDFIAWNPGARHRRRITQNFLKNLPVRSVLDVGCGPGEYLQLLRDTFGERAAITGVDLSPLVTAANRIRYPYAAFAELDITTQALDAQYDLVICCEVLEHLEKRREAFANLVEMVSPSGYLFVSCPTGHMYETERSFGHVSHPTMSEIESLGAENKLTLTRRQCWGAPLYAMTKYLVNINAEKSIKHFANGAYSLPQKLICQAIYLYNFLNLPHSKNGVQLFYLFQKK